MKSIAYTLILASLINPFFGLSNFEDAVAWLSEEEVDINNINTTLAWINWKERFGMTYPNATEEQARYTIWLANWNAINNHNKNTSHTHKQRLHQYSDLTFNEVKDVALGYDSTQNFTIGSEYTATGNTLPSSIDWRNYNGKNCVTPVKNQGRCGSCWSFATTGVIESRQCTRTNGGLLTSLSEQELVSCYANNCNGNTYFGAMNWVKTNLGLCSESNYPYTAGGGVSGTCNNNCGTKYDPITGYSYVTQHSESALMAAVAEGPVAVTIEASSAFMGYSSGILTAACGIAWNHAVLVIGYGTENGIDYWTIKNSWGQHWGDQGYIRICRNCNKNIVNGINYGQCGILGFPGVPTFGAQPTLKGCRNQAGTKEVVADKIYACKGTFAGGVKNGENLCTNGYSICKTSEQVASLGLTAALCTSNSIFTTNTEFYATLQSSQGNAKCTEIGTNDIWGCSNTGLTPKWKTPCGVLQYRLGNTDPKKDAPLYWSWSTPYTESSTATLSNELGGGVLCCKEGIGCRDSSNEMQVIQNKIYACSGAFVGGIMASSKQICSKEYEVCRSGAMASSLGLTKDLCTSTTIFSNTNKFYATAQSSNGNWICTPSGTNDIWGCSNPNLPHKYSGHNCSTLQYMIGNEVRPVGWSWSSDTTESSTATLSTKNGGGILCCSVSERVSLGNTTEYSSQCKLMDSDQSSAYVVQLFYVFIFVIFFVFIS